MPVYNVEQYVERALLSALNQSYENIEFIIVDDKGSDKSIEIVKEVILKHPRGEFVKILEHDYNRGTGATKNTAINNAKGKYLYFMDSDDEISSDCISKLYDEICRSKTDLVCGSYRKVSLINTVDYSMQRVVEFKPESILLSYFDGRFPVYTWNKLYNIDFLRKNKCYCVDSQTVEDNYFTFQILISAKSYAVIPDITYYYILRENSTTNANTWSIKVFEQWRNIFIDQLKLLKKKEFSPSLMTQILEKMFWSRVSVSERAMFELYDCKKYITSYLNIKNDGFVFSKSMILYLCYLLSKSPYWVKIIFLKVHVYIFRTY